MQAALRVHQDVDIRAETIADGPPHRVLRCRRLGNSSAPAKGKRRAMDQPPTCGFAGGHADSGGWSEFVEWRQTGKHLSLAKVICSLPVSTPRASGGRGRRIG